MLAQVNLTLRDTIAANLADVRGRMARAAERAGRDPATIRLIAVSKTFDAATVVEALHAGVTDLGENRVQEAAEKIPAVSAAGANATWHLIGPLQTNKAKSAVLLFDVIHSVDSLHLAEEISRRAVRPVPVLLEVNVGAEASKFGTAVADVPELVRGVGGLPNLELRGLMTVAPFVVDPEEVRPVFRTLRALRDRLGLAELSMGMTGDFEVAIEEGATMVRIGRAIFGPRPAL